MKTIEEIRSYFPALSQKVYGKQLVYFDNAATSQRPYSVLELQQRISGKSNANIHRAVHFLSSEATELYEKGREAVMKHIGGVSRGEVIFTSGATASLNLLACSFVKGFVGKGDKVLVSEAEHHSNIVPWQIACDAVGAEIAVLPVAADGSVDLQLFDSMLDDRVKIVSVTHVSNVLGVVNPVQEIIRTAHSKGIPVALDGAQAIVHSQVDVKSLDCDFYAFSGHKMFAPTGTGVLYGKRHLLEKMPPYMGGGEMVDTVTFARTTYAPPPLKFEAGTPNFIGAACLAPALEFAEELMRNDEVKAHVRVLTEMMVDSLREVDGLVLYGLPSNLEMKVPVFSFTVDGVHPTDLAQILDKLGIAVRSGLMCAEPLVRKFSETGMLRASLMVYNTEEEIDYFVTALKRAVAMLR